LNEKNNIILIYNEIYFPTKREKKTKNEKEKEEENCTLARVTSFYLPHMEYEGSIGLVTRKMKIFYC
jgi:hypothetical protein